MSDAKTEPTAIPPHVEHFISYAHALAERLAKVLQGETSAAALVALMVVIRADLADVDESQTPQEILQLRELLRIVIAAMVKSAPEVTVQ